MAMILEKTILDLSLDVRRGRAGEMPSRLSDCALTELPAIGRIQVATTRFGLLEADRDLILTFPDGLIGFERCTRYIVVRHENNSAFRWLQSLDEPHIAFPIVEPGEFCAGYAPTISDTDAHFLKLDKEAPVLLFAIVTVPPRTPRDLTANLLGPLVINGLTRRGRQVIVQDEGYTTRHKLIDELARRQNAARAI